MREETNAWLTPMLEEATARLDPDRVSALMRQATMPAAEAGPNPSVDQAIRVSEAAPDSRAMAIDWIRYGHLLRHELGWDDTYPLYPDFPELRDMPSP